MAERPSDHKEYVCSKGHYQASQKELGRCVAARCDGELKRIGRGSRKVTEQAAK